MARGHWRYHKLDDLGHDSVLNAHCSHDSQGKPTLAPISDAAATTPARPHPTPAQIGIITFTWNLYTIGALALSIVLLVLFLLVYGGTLGLTMSGSSADGTIGNTSFI